MNHNSLEFSTVVFNIATSVHHTKRSTKSPTMAAKGRKFSFMSMITKPEFPKMFGDANDIDLSTKQLDDLVEYQLGLQNPRYLIAGSFFVAGLTDSKATSEKIYKALLKASIISAPSSSESNDPVITSAIGKNYRSQVSFTSQYA